MAKIVPKLNLNKTPQIVENASLVFAKNIKVTKDGSIVRDDGIIEVTAINDILSVNNNQLVGYITYNTCIYLFIYSVIENNSAIYKYDERLNTCIALDTAWHYEGYVNNTCSTQVFGEAIVNLNSDVILIVSEKGNDSLMIPIKYINLNRTSSSDNESIYTQSPRIPIINLIFVKKYTRTIPNGIYQFFVRYEIKKGYYTNWMPCSKEMYSGTQILQDTIQGSVKYINTNSDSTESFIFNVDNLTGQSYGYKSFQIGFILSHDDSTVARAWKHFGFDVHTIYFDYDTDYIEEVNIDDMLDSVYQVYNAKNITNFKNKVYISNYKESDFNPDFSSYAEAIEIELGEHKLNSDTKIYYKDKPIGTLTLPNGELGYTDFLDESDVPEGNTFDELLDKLLIGTYKGDPDVSDPIYDSRDDNTYSLYPKQHTTQYNLKYYYREIGQYMWEDGNEVLANPSYNLGLEIYYIKVKLDNITDPIELTLNKSIYTRDEYWTQGMSADIEKLVLHELAITSDTRLQYYAFDGKGYVYVTDGTNIHKIEYIEYKIHRRHVYNTWMPHSETNVSGYYYFTIDGFTQVRKLDNFIITKFIARKHYTFDFSSLIPFKSYTFYVHYVKETGETTNGYKIREVLATNTDLSLEEGKVIYPKFSNITYPEGYPYCFISIVDTNNNVSQIFNKNNCLDIDSLLLPVNKDIRVYSLSKLNAYIENHPDATKYDVNDIPPTLYANYIYSGKYNVDYPNYFGASGKLVLGEGDKLDDNYNLPDGDPAKISELTDNNAADDYFIVQPNEKNQDNIVLTKCTPYLNGSSFDSFNDMNLLGYVCSVCKPTVNEDTWYISGSDVYSHNSWYSGNGHGLDLTPLDSESDINYASTDLFIVYSEFNLNYLSLSQEISTRVIGLTKSTSASDDSSVKVKRLVSSFESLILADIYELKSMYKDYRKKLFFPKEDDTITVFNNTIRASEVHSDEGVTYILKFEATQYYNVPTNKGYITNLKAIADKILVHTQDSLYSFSGSSKLDTNNGNAQLSESDPFDTGITELFGSEHGFVGLEDNRHTMISYDGYFFFDKDAKTIYDYSGQGLVLLSDPLERLLSFRNITDVIFANDYYNDRFFMLIKFNGGIQCNISFNYKQKTFVSLHDFDFEDSVATKVNCYFIKNNKFFVVDKNTKVYDEDITFIDSLLPRELIVEETDNSTRYASIVDVIFNDNFERIKTLDYINWIGSIISENFKNNNYFIATEPAVYSDYSVDKLRVYSDSCSTELIDVSQKDYHNADKEDYPNKNRLNDYKLPSFNNGVWTFNYLRNVFSKKNPTSGTLNPSMLSDNRSLIYGKYFVVRFVFEANSEFKLENVSINAN